MCVCVCVYALYSYIGVCIISCLFQQQGKFVYVCLIVSIFPRMLIENDTLIYSLLPTLFFLSYLNQDFTNDQVVRLRMQEGDFK